MADTTSLSVVCQGVAWSRPSNTERGHEFGEVGQRIVRAGSGLRMVLHRKERELAMTNSLYGSVVEIEVGDLERVRSRNPGRISNHSEAMVLSGDEDLIGPQISDWVIAPPVTVRQLRGRPPVGQPDELMSEADAERRKPRIGKLADRLQRITHRGWIARAIGKEESVRL